MEGYRVMLLGGRDTQMQPLTDALVHDVWQRQRPTDSEPAACADVTGLCIHRELLVLASRSPDADFDPELASVLGPADHV